MTVVSSFCVHALYLSSEKISFLSQTSVKIFRKAFYHVVNNDENSSYGTVQYSFYKQKKCLELFWQDMKTSLLSCFCRFLKLEWRIKISLKQRLYIISFSTPPRANWGVHHICVVRRKNCALLELFSFGRFLSKWDDAYFPSWGPFQFRKSL